jgi:hypothetical protein
MPKVIINKMLEAIDSRLYRNRRAWKKILIF